MIEQEIDWERIRQAFAAIGWDVIRTLHGILMMLILLVLLVLIVAATDLTYLIRHWNG